jgi:hypothetical protein
LIIWSRPVLEGLVLFKAPIEAVKSMRDRKNSLVDLPTSHFTKRHLAPEAAAPSGDFNTR